MFARILTLIAAMLMAGAHAQARGDEPVLDAYQAWKGGNKARLAQLEATPDANREWIAKTLTRLMVD